MAIFTHGVLDFDGEDDSGCARAAGELVCQAAQLAAELLVPGEGLAVSIAIVTND